MYHTLMFTWLANIVSNMGHITQKGSLDCVHSQEETHSRGQREARLTG